MSVSTVASELASYLQASDYKTIAFASDGDSSDRICRITQCLTADDGKMDHGGQRVKHYIF